MPNAREQKSAYLLLKFLIQKRLAYGGRKKRIPVLAGELGRAFGYSEDPTDDEICNIRNELSNLIFDEGLVECPGCPDDFFEFSSFIRDYRLGFGILLKYTLEDLKKYYRELWGNDQLKKTNPSIEELVGLKIEKPNINFDRVVFNPNQRCFIYKNKPPLILRRTEATKAIHLNLCLLLYGYPLTYKDHTGKYPTIYSESDYSDYKLGDPVDLDVTVQFIVTRGDSEYYDKLSSQDIKKLNKKLQRRITDAARNINAGAKEKLGLKIFKCESQEIWLLNT